MKNYSDIYQEVISLLKNKLELKEQTICESSEVANLTQDSIQLFELLLTFEQHYQIETAYADIANIKTVGDIANYIAVKKYDLYDR